MVERTEKSASADSKVALKEVLFNIFDYERSVGLWIKLSLTCRSIFLAFKHHAKDGKVKHLRHYNHGDFVSEHFVRRVCSRRIGKNLDSLSFEFSAITDEHIAKATLPASLKVLNFNACRELSERTLVQVSE